MTFTYQELDAMLEADRTTRAANARLDVSAVDYDEPCSGCGTRFTPGDLAMWSTDACDFFCFSCVAQAYESMKAAQSGT